MIDILFCLIIHGTTISGTVLMLWDAVKLLKSRSVVINKEIYDSEHSKVDYEKCTVTYDSLPETEAENIENSIGTILSGTAAIIALFIEFTMETEIQIDVYYKIIYSLLIGIFIAMILLLLKIILSAVVIKSVNAYAQRKGLVRKIPENSRVI